MSTYYNKIRVSIIDTQKYYDTLKLCYYHPEIFMFINIWINNLIAKSGSFLSTRVQKSCATWIANVHAVMAL